MEIFVFLNGGKSRIELCLEPPVLILDLRKSVRSAFAEKGIRVGHDFSLFQETQERNPSLVNVETLLQIESQCLSNKNELQVSFLLHPFSKKVFLWLSLSEEICEINRILASPSAPRREKAAAIEKLQERNGWELTPFGKGGEVVNFVPSDWMINGSFFPLKEDEPFPLKEEPKKDEPFPPFAETKEEVISSGDPKNVNLDGSERKIEVNDKWKKNQEFQEDEDLDLQLALQRSLKER